MTSCKLLERADAAFASLEIARELEHVAAGLERLTARTGDNRYRHAAAILRGRVGGRPPIDDAEALQEIERLITNGKSLAVALGVVSRRLAASNPEPVARRLRRKLKKPGRNGFRQASAGVQLPHERTSR